MHYSDLQPAPGSNQRRKRVARGHGSGHGKTAGRGYKGQKSRSGGLKNPAKFEGGQTPLLMRIPKRGMLGQVPGEIERLRFQTLNVDTLAQFFPEGGEVSLEAIYELGMVRRGQPVKLLGRGEVGASYQIQVHAVSASAQAKIQAAGGQVLLAGNAGA